MSLKPTKETLRNRKAGDALMREAAMNGDDLAAAYFELESIACQTSWGRFIVETQVPYDDDDWDDVRPF